MIIFEMIIVVIYLTGSMVLLYHVGKKAVKAICEIIKFYV